MDGEMVCTGYRDFTLRVEPLGRDGMRVRWNGSERVSHEVATFDLSPVQEWKTKLTRYVLDARKPRCLAREIRVAERRAGGHLFELLLRDKVKEQFFAERAAAESRAGRGLRLRLVFDLSDSGRNAATLAALPWELLYDPDRGDTLARSDKTPVVRLIDTRRPLAEPAESPLSVLAVEAHPSDLDALDSVELRHLDTRFGQRQDVELECLGEGSYEAVVERLRSRSWHAFHFMGHGCFDTDSGEGCLVFEGPRGKAQLVSSEQLAEELAEHLPGLRLVFLSACESARFAQDGSDPWSGLATALVRKGIPAVVAMQLPISSRAASLFAAAFYDALARGRGFEAAVAQGRRKISRSPEWPIPALYLRGSDGEFLGAAVHAIPGTDRSPPAEEDEVIWQPPSSYRPSRRAAGWSLGLILIAVLFLSINRVPRRDLPAAWVNPPECPSPPGLNLHMERIPSGSIVMGSDGEGPLRGVAIESLCMGAYEVTEEQWWRIMEPDAEPPENPDLPVSGVSREEALTFIRRLNDQLGGEYFRLPTEAEWEYAARAGTTTDYFFGDDLSLLPDYGNCLSNEETGEDGHDGPIPVGALRPNEWGLYDIHGNVSEWVSDDWLPSEPDAEVEGTRRGGSHASSPDNCRSAKPSRVLPARAQASTGLRLVREPAKTSPD